MFSRLTYMYHKKHRYLQFYTQDMISEKTDFKPYKIKLEIASKENGSFEFNHFVFEYEGKKYDMLDNELKVVS